MALSIAAPLGNGCKPMERYFFGSTTQQLTEEMLLGMQWLVRCYPLMDQMAAGMQSRSGVQQCRLKNANQNLMHPATRHNDKNPANYKVLGNFSLANYPVDKPVGIIMSKRNM
jgi:hypothetical protein